VFDISNISSSSDLINSQLGLIKDIFSTKKRYIHKYDKRYLIDALFYVLKTCCQWRMLPKDFPDWRAVYNQKKLNVDLRYGIIDSQTTKSNNICKDS